MVRSALYMATVVAMRHDPVIRACYEWPVAAGRQRAITKPKDPCLS